MKKLIVSVIFKLFMAIALINATAAFANSNAANSPDDTLIKFATEATYPPIVTMDAKGNIGGFETELVNLICKEANLKCSFQDLPFDSLFLSLNVKKIDAVYGGIGITDKRKDQVLFSKTLYKMPVGFIYKKDADSSSEQNYENKTIALQQGTAGFEQYLKMHYPKAKLKTYASIQDALLDLQNKRIQAVFGDIPTFTYWLQHKSNPSAANVAVDLTSNLADPNYQTHALTDTQASEFSQGNGIAVRKEDVLLMQKINAAFDKLVANGAVDKLKAAHGMLQK